MSLSRITNVAVTMPSPPIMRVLKKDTADSANTNASGTVRIKPSGGSYYTASWVYDPTTADGGYTHYADFSGFGDYFGIDFNIEVKDAAADASWTVWTSQANLFEVYELYAAAATVPGKPTLTIGSVTSSSQGLNWTTPTGGPTFYRLYRSTSPATGFVQIGGDLTATSFYVTGLSAATRYYYYVIPYNGTGTGTQSDTVNEITTSTGSGTQTPAPTVARHNAANELYRHAYKFTVSTAPFAVVDMEVGTAIRTASANAEGVCRFTPTEKIPVDVSTVRFRAAINNSVSAWTSPITVVDAPSSGRWVGILPSDEDGKYETYQVTFTGDPDSLPPVTQGIKISTAARATIAAARTDAFNYLETV